VTSGVARDARMYWGPYAASKAALEQMVKAYAAEMAHTSVRANLVDPGRVRTKMRAQAYPGEDPNILPTPDQITDVFVDLAEPACTKNGEIVDAKVRT
jgi:NAD(P)-dependent dehydrogenase (short-subunit alcohol dehydrogenase family)